MRRWVGIPAGAAPVVLIGGWTIAASRQPPGYDPVRDTISALAAHGATDRWIMTGALALLGLCHLATASGLTDAGVVARALLALGGVATVGVAVWAQPSAGHVPAATTGFIALALWSAAVTGTGRVPGVIGTGVLLALMVWLGFELGGGRHLGLSERGLAGAESLCPLAMVVAMTVRGHRAKPMP